MIENWPNLDIENYKKEKKCWGKRRGIHEKFILLKAKIRKDDKIPSPLTPIISTWKGTKRKNWGVLGGRTRGKRKSSFSLWSCESIEPAGSLVLTCKVKRWKSCRKKKEQKRGVMTHAERKHSWLFTGCECEWLQEYLSLVDHHTLMITVTACTHAELYEKMHCHLQSFAKRRIAQAKVVPSALFIVKTKDWLNIKTSWERFSELCLHVPLCNTYNVKISAVNMFIQVSITYVVRNWLQCLVLLNIDEIYRESIDTPETSLKPLRNLRSPRQILVPCLSHIDNNVTFQNSYNRHVLYLSCLCNCFCDGPKIFQNVILRCGPSD